ncbi:hypothetical protein, partial [Burkholderia multivorans]|uniref:hypothetical protein n=2 Tax=Burkholderia multivorans TaxID=87883 RepID=UPI0020A0BFF7
MTKDPNDTPPPHDPDSPDGAPATPPRPRRRGRALRVAGWALVALVLLVVLAFALVFAAATTERGTRLAWQTAVRVLGGRLAGTLEGGA